MSDLRECAVWYTRYGQTMYELCRDERAAAAYAYALEDQEEGFVSGVQFADGHLIDRESWQAFIDYGNERYDRMREAARQAPAPCPTRTVRDPFDNKPVTVAVDEPNWLGG